MSNENRKQEHMYFTADGDFSFNGDVSLDCTNKTILYQQDNATRMILDAIEKSEGNIQDAIKDGFDSENKSVDMKSKRNKNCEECENIISKLATKYQLLDNNIASTNKLLTVIGSVISILIAGFGIALTIFIFSVNSQYGAINDSVNSKFDSIDTKIEAINQRLDYQEKLNSFQIQRDVLKELKLQK